ncbi:unnamed protein product [Rhodiola kirilowii]
MIMAQRVQVPRFGNWEGEATIPYTICFDKASNGRARGEAKRPSSPRNNSEKLCSDASPARADHYGEKERPTEKQQHFDVPKFGDWGGQGDGVPYTVYFERVRNRGIRGRTGCENDKFAEVANLHGRREPMEEISPGHQKSPKPGVSVYEEHKQESKNRLQGSSSASLKGHEKMPTGRSPNSEHSIDGLPLPQGQARGGVKVTGHPFSERRTPTQSNFGISGEPRLRANTYRNEKVVPSAGISQVPSKVPKHTQDAKQPDTDNNSTYRIVPTKLKEQKTNSQKKCCFPWSRK